MSLDEQPTTASLMPPADSTWRLVHNSTDGEPATVRFGGWNCHVVLQCYADGERPLLRLIDADDMASVARATVNLPGAKLAEDELLVKDYAENEGALQALIDAGLVEPTGRGISTGFATVEVVQMSESLRQQWIDFRRSLLGHERGR